MQLKITFSGLANVGPEVQSPLEALGYKYNKNWIRRRKAPYRLSLCYVQLTCHGSCVWKVSVVSVHTPILSIANVKKQAAACHSRIAFLLAFMSLTKPCQAIVNVRV